MTRVMRKRTQARETALQGLYQCDLNQNLEVATQDVLGGYEDFVNQAGETEETRQYAWQLIWGVVDNLADLDQRIAAVSENWRLNRTAAVDRGVLRIGLFELLECTEIPPKVAINEAIELVKKFSAEQSGAFVNGIPDTLYNQIHGETVEDES